jgi:hypothetical protein
VSDLAKAVAEGPRSDKWDRLFDGQVWRLWRRTPGEDYAEEAKRRMSDAVRAAASWRGIRVRVVVDADGVYVQDLRTDVIRKADEIAARPPEVVARLGNGANRADRRHLLKHRSPSD